MTTGGGTMIELSNYVRNIAVFLIFASFVTIILPGKKYEQYVNLVLGIILIFVVTAPLAGVIGALAGGSGDIFRDVGLTHDRAVLARQIESGGEAQLEMILSGYKEALTAQVDRIVQSHGEFELIYVEFDVDVGENFGEILAVRAVVGESAGNRTPLISIDPVRIALGVNDRGQATEGRDVESPQIMSLKSAISDFYNLDIENIILETRD